MYKMRILKSHWPALRVLSLYLSDSGGFLFGAAMPTRYLKPGIRDSELIDRLSPLAETLFYRLLVTVDDFGRFDARAAMIKAQCFPVKDSVTAKQCGQMLKEIADAGLIFLYEVDGRILLQVQKWDNAPRAKESKYPQPNASSIQLHTDVRIPRTVLPVTVTVTETVTKTETGTDNAAIAVETFPHGLDVQAWQSWLSYRKGIGKPLKPASWEAAQRAMAAFGDDQAAVVAQSIANGYQGLFAIKGKAKQAQSFRERDAQIASDRVAQVAPSIAANKTAPYVDAADFIEAMGKSKPLEIAHE